MRAHANVISRVCTIDKIQTRRSGKRGSTCPVVAVATAEREYSSDAVDSSCRRRANREPRGRLRGRRSQSFTTVLETTTTMTVRHGCCRSVVATARVQRRTRDEVALGAYSCPLCRARGRGRVEKTCERARRRESEEYDGKSRRERDRTKRGKKNMSLTKGRGRK